MSRIKAICHAPGDPQAAAYAGKTADEDILAPVLSWTVIEFDEGEPDEVVGQIFDGQCITEATSVDEEEGFGEFVGYFALTSEGKKQAKAACNAFRERLGKKGKKKKKKEKPVQEVDEQEDLDEEIEDEEDEDEFGGFLDDDESDDIDEEEDEDDDQEGD